MRSTFKLLYFVKRNAVKKNGNAPIIARITIDQVVAQFNTKLEIKSGSLEREVRQGFRKNHRSRTHQFHAGEYSQHGTSNITMR